MLGQPSVIARLMGMEDHMTVVPAMSAAGVIQAAEETTISLLMARPSSSAAAAFQESAAKVTTASKLKQFKCSAFPHHGRINVEYYRYCLSKMKPRRRSRRDRSHRREHHPQEELLEKIKEEFRASWQQASMASSPLAEVEVEGNAAVTSARRSSSADGAGWVDVDGRYIQRVAQANLRREKMARYGHGKSKVEEEEDAAADDDGKIHVLKNVAEAEQHQGDGEEDIKAVAVVTLKNSEEAKQQHGGSEDAAATVSESEAASSDSHRAGPEEEFFRDSGGAAVVSGDHHQHDQMSSASENSRGTPTRIAILRPIGTTRAAAGDHREPAFGTPPPSWKATRNDGGMEEFLRAVKERLDNEMKAKTGTGDVVEPSQTARRVWGSADMKGDTARQIRDTKEDLGRRLSRLESFRVFRGDRAGKGLIGAVKSPEHRMLKRVRARIEAMSPKKTRLSGPSSPVSSRGGRAWSSPPADFGPASSLSGVVSDEEVDEGEGMSCCTGDRRRLMTRLWKVHGAASTADTHVAVSPTPSPRALVRSLSAPASWRVSDGGSEVSCGEGAEATLRRSRSFSLLRGTVASGLKQSFRLLLLHLTKNSSPSSPQDSGSLITASQADFLAGLAPPSPVSPLEVHGRSPRHFSGCTFLPESSPRRSPRCSSEFGASVHVGGESPWRWKTDAAAESDDDPDKAYIRELLIAAGLFDDDNDGGESSDDTGVARTDATAGLIMSDEVLYAVEDAYYYRRLRRRVDEDGAGEEEEDGWTDRRRLLFDLANDALQALQAGPSCLSSSLRQWFVDNGGGGNGVSLSSSRLRLRGRDLEDEVWRHVARAIREDDDGPAPGTKVDGMVELEVRKSPWMDALREDVVDVGRKVERAIFDELVSEVLRQVFVRT